MRERFEKIYTAALTDILDDRGLRNQTLPHELRPLVPGSRVAGPAFTIEGRPSEVADWDAALRKVLEMLGSVPAGARRRLLLPPRRSRPTSASSRSPRCRRAASRAR